jgi:peptide/nickel transport system substrate-binding protein
MRVLSDWKELSPATGDQQVPGGVIQMAVYDRLVAVNAKGAIVPYLAKSWTVKPGSVTFDLRTDATCSDGTPVTAQVVADSLKYSFNGTPGSIITKFRFAPGPFIVTVVDATHVNVNVTQPLTDLLYPFAAFQASIICPAGLVKNTTPGTRLYGSGPYTLESETPGESVVLKRRPEWKWGPEGSSSDLPNELVVKVIVSETTAANLLQTGGLDVAQVYGADVSRLQADKSLSVQTTYASVGGEVAVFNLQAGRSTADRAVREALATAIDPQQWSKAANDGRARIATAGILDINSICYDASMASALPTPNVEKAKGILLAAGFVAGGDGKLAKGGKPLTIEVVTNPTQLAGPEYLLETFLKLGVSATIVSPDGNRIVNGAYDVYVYTLQNPTPDPLLVIHLLIGPGSNGRNRNPVAEKAVQEAREAPAQSEACRLVNVAQRTVLQNYEFRPMNFPEAYWFTKKGITLLDPRLQQLEPYTISRQK